MTWQLRISIKPKAEIEFYLLTIWISVLSFFDLGPDILTGLFFGLEVWKFSSGQELKSSFFSGHPNFLVGSFFGRPYFLTGLCFVLGVGESLSILKIGSSLFLKILCNGRRVRKSHGGRCDEHVCCHNSVRQNSESCFKLDDFQLSRTTWL